MRYRLHLSAWDVMDRVHVSMRLFDDQNDGSETVIDISEEVQGIGESDPWTWAKDALIAAIEGL